MTSQLSNLKKRLLQGIKAKCVDGQWSADDLPLPDALLVTGYTRGLQCWQNGELLDELDEREIDLPDLGELNDKIPQNEWKTGLDGKPEPPWRIVFVVYLTDLETAELYTWINSGWFASVAYEQLTDKIERMTRLRGRYVTAIVKPSRKPMKIKKLGITKQRPHFEPIEWRDLGPPLPPQQSPAQLPPPADNGSSDATAKAESSTPPWKDLPANPAATTGTAPAERKPATTVGKPVAPITTEEEFNDTLESIYWDPPSPKRSSNDDDFIF